MIMRSHDLTPPARWGFLAATLVYVLAAAVVPVLHFAEEMGETGSHPDAALLGAVVHFHAGEGGGSHSGDLPGDAECTFCQAFSTPAQTASVQPVSSLPRVGGPLPFQTRRPLGSADALPGNARAPPIG